MKFYTCGDPSQPVILLIPGLCAHHSMFDGVLDNLRQSFYVVVASFDGFDENEDTYFISMEDACEKMETYILERFNGHIDCVYGCSYGGSYAALMMERQRVRFSHVILDSTPFDDMPEYEARTKARLAASVLERVYQGHKRTRQIVSARIRMDMRSTKAEQYMKTFSLDSDRLRFVSRLSLYNMILTTLVTPVGNYLDVKGTKVHVFYATKMGEKYHLRYFRHFINPRIISFPLGHEELLVAHPDHWCRAVKKCCGLVAEDVIVA